MTDLPTRLEGAAAGSRELDALVEIAARAIEAERTGLAGAAHDRDGDLLTTLVFKAVFLALAGLFFIGALGPLIGGHHP